MAETERLDHIWGDRFVGESTLTSRVKAARRAVSDEGTTQRIIRTVHGRGYRFVAAVPATQTPARGRTAPTVGAAHPLHGHARRRAAGVPFAVTALGTDVPDPHGRYARDLGIAHAGAVLVRPDGHVSWRTTDTPAEPSAELRAALASTLGHPARRLAGPQPAQAAA